MGIIRAHLRANKACPAIQKAKLENIIFNKCKHGRQVYASPRRSFSPSLAYFSALSSPYLNILLANSALFLTV